MDSVQISEIINVCRELGSEKGPERRVIFSVLNQAKLQIGQVKNRCGSGYSMKKIG